MKGLYTDTRQATNYFNHFTPPTASRRRSKRNSICHVCWTYPAEQPLFALLLGDTNILSTAYVSFWDCNPLALGLLLMWQFKG